MKQVHALLLLFLTGAAPARSQDLVWARQLNDTATGHIYISDNLVDRYGNVYVAGQFGGWVDLDPGPAIYPLISLNSLAAFIAKYDSSGTLLWARAIISDSTLSNGSGINAIAADSAGNIYALGYFQATADFDPGPGTHELVSALGPDMFVEKFDAAGNFAWVVQFPGTHSVSAKDIAVDAVNDVFITGAFGGAADFDPSASVHTLTAAPASIDIFLLKMRGNGSLLWASQISGASSEYPASMAVTADGGLYLTGYYYGTADFDPGPAVRNLSSNGYGDIFIAKFDGSGGLVWANSFGDTGEDVGVSIACDKAGNVYATGRFMRNVDFDPGAAVQMLTSAGYYDLFILKLDGNGGYRWAERTGAADRDNGMSISVTDATVYVAGSYMDTVDLDPGPGSLYMGTQAKQQFAYLSLDTAGALKWAVSQEHAINTAGNCYMGEDAAGYIYTTGQFYGTIDCDPGPAVHDLTVGASLRGYFILKLEPAAPAAVPAMEMSSCSVYPNPAAGAVNIVTGADVHNGKLRIVDLTGREVLSRSSLNGAGFTLDMTGLPAGLYLLELADAGSTFRTSIIKN